MKEKIASVGARPVFGRDTPSSLMVPTPRLGSRSLPREGHSLSLDRPQGLIRYNTSRVAQQPLHHHHCVALGSLSHYTDALYFHAAPEPFFTEVGKGSAASFLTSCTLPPPPPPQSAPVSPSCSFPPPPSRTVVVPPVCLFTINFQPPGPTFFYPI